jgi:hypothetical protein
MAWPTDRNVWSIDSAAKSISTDILVVTEMTNVSLAFAPLSYFCII